MKQREIRTITGGIGRIHIDRASKKKGSGMTSRHCHSYFELYYVENGSCQFIINNNIYELHSGDFIMIPPHLFHITRYIIESCKRVDIYFRMEDVGKEALSCLPNGPAFFSQMQLFQVPEAYQRHITNWFSRMLGEALIEDELSAPLLYFQLQELLLFCVRVCNFLQEMPARIQTTNRQVLEAARFISQNYMRPITTAEIAQAAGYSPNYLTREFREKTGIGIHEYLVFIRLQQAAMELLSTNDTITQVALRCGFSDGNYFKDVFKKKFGITPREYRQSGSLPINEDSVNLLPET